MRRLACVSAVAVASALACSPTAPSPPVTPVPNEPHFAAGTSLWFTSGETGQPVTGASVWLSGIGASGAFERTIVTDPTGRIVLDAPLLHTPAPAMDVTAAGFFKRETTLEPEDGSVFTLWPTSSPTGLDEEFSATVVYSSARCPARRDPGFLWRHDLATERATVVLGPTMQTDQDVQVHQQAIDAVNLASGNRPQYVLALTPPSDGVHFTTRMDPQFGVCPVGGISAYILLEVPNGIIAGGHIVYCAASHARNPRVVAHELGHSLGLHHSAVGDTSDVMSCVYALAPFHFSPRESLALSLVRQRPGRNLWPDRDRPHFPSGPAAVGRMTTTIVCPG